MWHVTVAALGFSLNVLPRPHPQPQPQPQRRLQVANDEPCTSSCDAGEDQECDDQDSRGDWTRSCDLHPTTSCDDGCSYSPPPPRAPWLENGTYPAPPPPPPPPDYAHFGASVGLFVFVVLLLICACVWTRFVSDRNASPNGRWLRYWCCCCVPFDDWERNRQHRRGALSERWTPELEAAAAAETTTTTTTEEQTKGTLPDTRGTVFSLDLPSLNLSPS